MNNHEGHIKLWDELARTGGDLDDKFDLFDELFPDVDDSLVCNACFACIETAKRTTEHNPEADCMDCIFCPIDWGDKYCDSDKSPYSEWDYSDNPKERKRLAAIIRDLPWKEKES
jgi:hypothetical protein